MRQLLSFVILTVSLSSTGITYAESHNPADYPLRIHIYRRNEATFYHNRQTEEAKGEGRANLFEGGEPKGVDFQFDCDSRLQTSSGYETYPAKWRKPGLELTILQPQFGKNGYSTCRLKVMMKDFVYVSHNGVLSTEGANVFKDWMTKHDYDPEHDKNLPVRNGPSPTGPADATPPSSAPPVSGSTPPEP